MASEWRLDRRTFVSGSMIAPLAALGGSAQAASLTIPVVDSLVLHTIVDSATFGPFLADQSLPGLRVVRSGGGPARPRMPRQPLMAEFGLSILGVSTIGDETRRVLVDFGYSREVMANNLTLLNLDPATFDAAVLSHGHLDHYGGFAALGPSRAGKAPLPVLVGGEETFCERIAFIGTPPPVMGSLDRSELAAAGLAPRIATEPEIVAGHAFTSGHIPLKTFERAVTPTRMRPGVGCERAHLSPTKAHEDIVADDAEHELATCYAVRDLGLVVIASCSHRGVLNSVRQAQAVSGIDKVHAIVGGFHLVSPRTPDEALRTATEMAELDPAYVVPMHCTGEEFVAQAMRLMPSKVVRPYVGNRLVFSASV